MPTTATTSLKDPGLLGALERLATQLRQIGITLTVHGPTGESLTDKVPCSKVCQQLCGAPEAYCAARADWAKQVWAEEKPKVMTSRPGCIVMGIPVLKRRRMVAAALACYLPTGATETEEFARECDYLHLDRQAVASLVDRPTHPADEAPSWIETIQWMIDQSLQNAVARNELAAFSSNLGSTYEELSLLYRLSGAMKVDTSSEEFFQRVCTELLEVMHTDAAAVVLTDRVDPGQAERVVRAGRLEMSDEKLRTLVKQLVQPELPQHSHGLVINQIDQPAGEGQAVARNLLAVPLVTGELALGTLLAINKTDAEDGFDSTEQKLMHSVAGQASVFQANRHLYGELQELLMGVLHLLTASIDAKDQYTCGHSQRVAMISRRLAEMCKLKPEAVETIYLSGLLHDIGKIGVPESVLCKPGRLSDEEFETMKRHSAIGANILSNIRQMQAVIPGVLHHHERPDGRGYPSGLAGKDVPFEGLIVGLGDCFDAMTSCRTYRNALPLEKVVAEIMRFSGTQFHPTLVDHLLSLDLPAFVAELREAKPMVSAISGIIRASAA